MEAKIVVIVSGKADEKEEWKKTVEKIANFDGFVFLDGELLLRDENIIKSNIDSSKKVAIFLTLQDLQGDEIKAKHKEVFDSQIDLLIVDETHYGARAAEYGKVLQNAGLTAAQIKKELKQKDIESIEDMGAEVKRLKAKITLHLSGTPYRILMSSEFSEDDIVSFCQFTDIIDASDKWIERCRISSDRNYNRRRDCGRRRNSLRYNKTETLTVCKACRGNVYHKIAARKGDCIAYNDVVAKSAIRITHIFSPFSNAAGCPAARILILDFNSRIRNRNYRCSRSHRSRSRKGNLRE
jgi:hypothetical protein